MLGELSKANSKDAGNYSMSRFVPAFRLAGAVLGGRRSSVCRHCYQSMPVCAYEIVPG